jgi:hypothetical protein
MSRAADFATYIAIGLALVIGTIFVAENTDLTRAEREVVGKWIRFGLYSAVVLVGTAISRKAFWIKPRLWLLWLLLALVHTLGLGALVAQMDGWNVLLSVILAPLEYVVLDGVLRKKGYPGKL